jgi:flagellar hook-length control protein FliK
VEVSVTMTTSGAAHISITAATADGYAALTASHADLLQHLAQSGVAVGSVQTQLQSDSGQNGASGSGPRQSQNRPAPAASWVKQGQDETVIAYA